MTRTRAAAWIAGSGLLVAWLAAAANPPVTPVPTAAPQRTPLEGKQPWRDLNAETDRLQHWLATAPLTRPPMRNPFKFVAPDPVPHSSGIPAAGVRPTVPAPPPPLTLAGIAENDAGGTITRTAIVSADGQVFLAREGEIFADRYRVVRIGADAVELRDETADVIVRLGLP